MSRSTARWWAAAGVVSYVAIILAVGLNPREGANANDVAWLSDSPGIAFDGHGLAYTPRLSHPDAGVAGEPARFTVLLALRLREGNGARGFEHIATIFGDDVDSQLLIGHWHSSLIATNGTDYDYRQRRPRLTAALDGAGEPWHLVALCSDTDGSRLFVDGQLRAVMDDRLELPVGDGGFRLLLGNSAHGNKGWFGAIGGLVLLPYALDDETALLATRHPGEFAQLQLLRPWVWYTFSEGAGARTEDRAPGGADLEFRRDEGYLVPEFFQLGLSDARLPDVAINLAGFVPFGFLCAWLLSIGTRNGLSATTVGVATVLAGCLLSGAIELVQAWLPMRTSSLLDLVLNTLGTAVGVVMCLRLQAAPPTAGPARPGDSATPPR
jgi:hypothetical protein